MRAKVAPFLEQVDRGALVVLEGEHLTHAGDGIVAQLAGDAVGRKVPGELAEIGIGRHLEGEPVAVRAIRLLELHHQQPGLGGEKDGVDRLGVYCRERRHGRLFHGPIRETFLDIGLHVRS